MKRISENMQKTYLVLGCKPWNRRHFDEALCHLPGMWHYIGSPVDFTNDIVNEIKPRYIFVLHWSWKIPEELVKRYECVCFHMTDVPFGRGGSPFQNLVVRGIRNTKLTALRMSSEFDAGPVYLKVPLSLDGGAEEVYLRAGQLSTKMIHRIIRREPKPVPQRGKPLIFQRRGAEQSEVGHPSSLEEFYDFIRMLDAEGYPRAFLHYSGFRLEFSRPALYDRRIVADVKITRRSDKEASK